MGSIHYWPRRHLVYIWQVLFLQAEAGFPGRGMDAGAASLDWWSLASTPTAVPESLLYGTRRAKEQGSRSSIYLLSVTCTVCEVSGMLSPTRKQELWTLHAVWPMNHSMFHTLLHVIHPRDQWLLWPCYHVTWWVPCERRSGLPLPPLPSCHVQSNFLSLSKCSRALCAQSRHGLVIRRAVIHCQEFESQPNPVVNQDELNAL